MLCVPVQTDDAYRAKSWGLTKTMGYCQRLKHMMHVVIAVSHTAGLTALLQSGCLPVLICSTPPPRCAARGSGSCGVRRECGGCAACAWIGRVRGWQDGADGGRRALVKGRSEDVTMASGVA